MAGGLSRVPTGWPPAGIGLCHRPAAAVTRAASNGWGRPVVTLFGAHTAIRGGGPLGGQVIRCPTGGTYCRRVRHDVPAVARYLLLVTVVIWLVLELRQSANNRPEATKADGGSRPTLRAATLIGVIGALVASRAAPGATIRPAALAAWIGLGILWCGIALRFWSFQTLGRYFTFTVQTSSDQPVITAGPYRVIRHPSYAGVLLAVIGLGLIIGNWLSLLVLTAAVAWGLVFRIRVEERALLEDIGDDYRSYAATHKRLVPFLW